MRWLVITLAAVGYLTCCNKAEQGDAKKALDTACSVRAAEKAYEAASQDGGK
jgi:hypothetical protein